MLSHALPHNWVLWISAEGLPGKSLIHTLEDCHWARQREAFTLSRFRQLLVSLSDLEASRNIQKCLIEASRRVAPNSGNSPRKFHKISSLGVALQPDFTSQGSMDR